MSLGLARGITPLGSDLASVLYGHKGDGVKSVKSDQYWVQVSAMDKPKKNHLL